MALNPMARNQPLPGNWIRASFAGVSVAMTKNFIIKANHMPFFLSSPERGISPGQSR